MNVLLADDEPERARDLARLLATDPAINVVRVRAGQLLADAVAAQAPEVVIVDMARPDRDALEAVRQVSSFHPRPIVLFVDEDDPAFMEAAIGAGVSSYNVAGAALSDVKPILRAAVALFRQHQQTRLDLRQSERRLRERIAIERAKAMLIRERRMTEPEAHRLLQRRAMASGQRIAEVADALLRAGDGAKA